MSEPKTAANVQYDPLAVPPPVTEPKQRLCIMPIWEGGPKCDRRATHRTVSEFFAGKEGHYCARHARLVADLYEVKVGRLASRT